jgi:hypothetical protein
MLYWLLQVFGAETIAFQQIPELVNRHLGSPEPVVLHYSLNPTVHPAERPAAWDVEIKMEDTALKNRMATSVQMSKESVATLMKLDEEVRRVTLLKRVFFFSPCPQQKLILLFIRLLLPPPLHSSSTTLFILLLVFTPRLPSWLSLCTIHI